MREVKGPGAPVVRWSVRPGGARAQRPAAAALVYERACEHGSAKSVIASEHVRRLAAERGLAVDVGCAGTEPAADIPARVVDGLLADGIEVRALKPRAATRTGLQHASRVIPFGCDVSQLRRAACRSAMFTAGTPRGR